MQGFWSKLAKFFNSQPKENHVKQSVAKPKKSAYVSVDETQVKVDIVQNLTEFFKLQEQLAAKAQLKKWKSLGVRLKKLKGLKNEHLLHLGIVNPVSFADGLSRFLPLPLPKP